MFVLSSSKIKQSEIDEAAQTFCGLKIRLAFYYSRFYL